MTNLETISVKKLLKTFTACLISFVLLSWLLLFRDELRIQSLELAYPFFNGLLFLVRSVLLQYSLNVVPTILYAFTGAVAFVTYFLLLKKQMSTSFVVRLAITFQLLVFCSYPILSTDIFYYIFSDRVSSTYGQNKWMVAPEVFPDDVFYGFTDWKDKTNIYGVVNHILYLPASHLAGNDIFINIFLYKLTILVFAIGSIFVLKYIFESISEEKQAYYLKLIFFNPLFLLEILGSGHNDGLFIFFVLLSVFFWKKDKMILSGIFIVLATQVKLIAGVLFCYLLVALIQRKKFSQTVYLLLITAFLFLISFFIMQIPVTEYLGRLSYNTISYWQSLPGLVSKFLPQLSIPFTALFCLLCTTIIYLQFIKKWDPIYSTSLTLFIYLAFFSGAYWNWYVLWIFVFVPFLEQKLFSKMITFLTVTSFFAYPLLWFSHRFGFGQPIWDLTIYLWIFGVPIAFLGYNYTKRKRNNYE